MATNYDMGERLARLEHKINGVAYANKTQFEQVREDIKKLGEGYEAALKQVLKQIADRGQEPS